MFTAFTNKLTTTLTQITHNLDAAHAADLAKKKAQDGGDFAESDASVTSPRFAFADVVKDAVTVALARPAEGERKEAKSRNGSADVTMPWEGFENEEGLKKEIFALSGNKETFTTDPPSDAGFDFDMNANASVAMRLLELDPNLQQMRYELVPRKMKDPIFWRNYFHHIHLLTTHHALTHLNDPSSAPKGDASPKHSVADGSPDAASDDKEFTTEKNVAAKSKPKVEKTSPADQGEGPTAKELREVVGLPSHLNDEASHSMDYEEFASDAYGSEWEQGEVLYEAGEELEDDEDIHVEHDIEEKGEK
ncbi:hypothetical protein HDV00_010595 [Rhizophlyctis rosea]|nr:hypothetical protein HDV00_010595 [Rhizophlyctis rosea]